MINTEQVIFDEKKYKKRVVRALVAVFLCAVLLTLSFLPLFTPDTFPVGAIDTNSENKSYKLDFSLATLMPVETGATSSILIDAKSLQVLAYGNSDARSPMASTTKIMTALLTLELMPLSSKFVIPKEAVGIEGSSIYLSEGETLTIEELLYGLLLESGNDSAVALAIAAAGSVDMFVALMNAKARELGMTKTRFANPNGLPDADHYTTAADLALLSAVAMRNETFAKIVATKKKTIPYKNVENGRYLVNHNKLLMSYDEIIGVKTGYTKASGRCLVTAYKNGDQILIAVTLNCPGDWSAHKNMHGWGVSNYAGTELIRTNGVTRSVNVVGGESNTVLCRNTEPAYVCLPVGEEVREVISVPDFVYAPVSKGEAVGYITYYSGDEKVLVMPLHADSDVKSKKIDFWKKIIRGTG
ncbi:MAG: D-alanyl-D-alanine carboxypeptidase [Eubacteriales bacterium]|nr:D-alanyl-D-alanine carboxypeptidase [Eubacteriales bacterium]MDD4475794.1 D-alanyl-D-alanine carboxypeptidase [Eubacteriales bacterium]